MSSAVPLLNATAVAATFIPESAIDRIPLIGGNVVVLVYENKDRHLCIVHASVIGRPPDQEGTLPGNRLPKRRCVLRRSQDGARSTLARTVQSSVGHGHEWIDEAR